MAFKGLSLLAPVLATLFVMSHALHSDDWTIDKTVFELKNTHRAHGAPVLRFSINGGVHVDKVSPVKPTADKIEVHLSDNSSIEIDHYSNWHNDTSEYQFIWKGAGPSLIREVCFHYGFNKASWYSTYEEKTQHWPMDTAKHVASGKSFTTADFFQADFGGIIEHLFINSDGFGVMLHELHPWFVRRDPNHGDPILCVAVSNGDPYPKLTKYEPHYFDLRFTIKTAKNVREVYRTFTNPNSGLHAKIPAPASIPDERIFRYPIWSTWAEFKKDINEHKVMDFAAQIKKHGFPNSQIEIDDFWEHKYGDFTFDTKKFPDPKKTIAELHKMGFRVTAWVYPFVNSDSVAYEANKAHLIKDASGQHPQKVHWWDGSGGAVDFSDPEAAKWFVDRLQKLKNDTGLDSYKFDAGELNWYGKQFRVKDPLVQQYPNLMTKRYVETCAKLGGMIEVRSAYKSQELPIFVRMLDKGSDWSIDNGLKTLVTTALTMSLAGYHFNLPDMIGGNAYGNHPDEELYIRWVQANAFLPSLQFSIPPWVYNDKTVNLTKKFVDLHVAHADTIIKLAHQARTGEPIIRPMWWAEPEDDRTYKIADQYMLGDDIVVAPVLEKGQRERQVYLPKGTWVDQHGASFIGHSEIKVKAPLEELPYFKRKH